MTDIKDFLKPTIKKGFLHCYSANGYESWVKISEIKVIRYEGRIEEEGCFSSIFIKENSYFLCKMHCSELMELIVRYIDDGNSTTVASQC
jgi:hypothetical protein